MKMPAAALVAALIAAAPAAQAREGAVWYEDAHAASQAMARLGPHTSPNLSKPVGPGRYIVARAVYRQLAKAAAQRYRLPPALVAAVIKCESDWNPRAISHAGARGMMQVMPATARGEFQIDPARLWDPALNVLVGTAYLRRMADLFPGRARLAIAAYNAGPTRVRAGILPAETRAYTACVLRWYGRYKAGGY